MMRLRCTLPRSAGRQWWIFLPYARTPTRSPDVIATCDSVSVALTARSNFVVSAICVRIGRVKVEDRPISVRDFAVWCSQRDVVRLLELCITAPATVRFDVFFVVSDNRWGYRDLEHARAVLGFEPRDRAEDHRR